MLKKCYFSTEAKGWMYGEEIKIKTWYLCGAILVKSFPGGNVAERHFGKKKQHGERHSSVNMQVSSSGKMTGWIFLAHQY